MSSIYLEDYMKNAEFYLERFVPALKNGKLDWKGIQEMTTAFRQRGVCSLFLCGEPTGFFVNAMQSGGAFLHFLKRCDNDGKITSQAKPFFDAVGGGYSDCAKSIAENSRMSWAQGFEYEEDFLYVKFLMKHFFMDADENECRSSIDEFDRAQNGAEPERLAICQAFLSGDAQLFEDSLARILEKRQDKVEGMVERGALPEEVWSWLRYFSSEGLALIGLAGKKGFSPGPAFLHVPDVARADPPFSFDPDAWQHIDYTT